MPYAVSVTFDIDPDHWAAFLPLMHANAATSRTTEAGCLQFDVCTDDDHAHQVYLYEVYADEAAFKTHLASDHFAAFDAAAGHMITAKAVRTFRGVDR